MGDFVFDAESLVQQKSIYVAMATSVVVTFSDPIANVQGLAFLAWANKVDEILKNINLSRLASTKNDYLLCTINKAGFRHLINQV